MSPKYQFGLATSDKNVPEGYIGISELFSNEKYALPKYDPKAWCIGQKQLKKMRYETYRNVKKRAEMCNVSDYAKFWNGNLDAINDLGINMFSNLMCFRELATAMICFQATEANKISGIKRKMISWGIKDSIYRAYYKAQKKAVETGEEQAKVNLFDAKKSRNGNLFRLPDEKLHFETLSGGDSVVTIKRNAVFNRFELWCKAKDISKRDALYQAMMLIMQEYPVRSLKDLGAYQRKCDLDYEIVVPERSQEKMVTSTVSIPRNIHMQMRKIISGFNCDPENIGRPGMNISKYVAQAVDLLNRKSPLKYSDPDAYEKYLKAKQAEKYNELASQL